MPPGRASVGTTGLLFSESLEQGEKHLEQPGAGRLRVAAGQRGTELGQENTELAGALTTQQHGHLGGAPRTAQPAA